MIKGCDRLDNLRSIGVGTKEFRAKQVTETRRVYYMIFNRMVEISPHEHARAAAYLRDEIMKATETIEI